MEQLWGISPQPFAGPIKEERADASIYSILFIINKIKISPAFRSASAWHTNCSLLPPERVTMSPAEKRVLIVEPDPRQRRGLVHLLKNEDYHIETAKNLSEAIKKVSEGNFNCLIMDTHLPEMKGYEAVPIFKNLDPDLKIIMTTRKNTKRLETKVRQQDIFFYFIRSFGDEELKLALSNAFRQ